MKLARIVTSFLLLAVVPTCHAQTEQPGRYFSRLFREPSTVTEVREPQGFMDQIVKGKLRLRLADAIRLALANNPEVRIEQLTYEATRFALMRAYQPFDPALTSGFSATRSQSPTISQLQGAPILSNLDQHTHFRYSQMLPQGTRYEIGLNTTRASTNSVFAIFNPSLFSSLDFSLSQPLLRNRGTFPNRAMIVIAQRNQEQSRAGFEARVSELVRRVVDRYWAVVEARERLGVLQKSLELAEATYRQNKRALELGALPPLDIYRSEAEVASRRVSVIQAEYGLKQAEDELRHTMGADFDSREGALDLELVEDPEPRGELQTVDIGEATREALGRRPEIRALRVALERDDIDVQLAHNSLRPDLELRTFLTTNGRGGNLIDSTGPFPVLVRRGGFGDALTQLGSFDFRTYGFSLQLRLPLKNRAAEADLGNALSAKRRDLYTLRRMEQAISLEARHAVHQLEQAKLSMAAARAARDLAQKTLEADQRKYELGVHTIFFVLEAQAQLAQAELSLLGSQISYQWASVAADDATGRLLERYNVKLAGTAN